MKGSGKSVEAWHCERLGEATGEGAAPVSVEAPRIEGVMERRLWHHVGRSESLKGSQERLFVKVQSRKSREPEFWRGYYHGTITSDRSGREELAWAWETVAELESGAFWRSHGDHEYSSDVCHLAFYIVGLCFCFDLISSVSWLFLF